MPYPGPIAANNRSDYNVFKTGGRMTWLHMMPFVANINGGVDYDGIVEAYRKAWSESGDAMGDPPPLEEYHRGPLLDLIQWRILTGNDRHSTSAEKHVELVATEPTLRSDADDAYFTIECPAVEGVDRDFFGRPMPDDDRLPGPFQNLKRGKNQLLLWPIRP